MNTCHGDVDWLIDIDASWGIPDCSVSVVNSQVVEDLPDTRERAGVYGNAEPAKSFPFDRRKVLIYPFSYCVHPGIWQRQNRPITTAFASLYKASTLQRPNCGFNLEIGRFRHFYWYPHSVWVAEIVVILSVCLPISVRQRRAAWDGCL